MVLPGAPRKPSSWALGWCQSPMQAKFWLPYRSIWLAPIITWRLPFHSTLNICGYGFHASTTDLGVGHAHRHGVGREHGDSRRS